MIEPFLRIENTPAEQGYNTSNGTPVDDKAGPWTHDLTLGELQNTKVTRDQMYDGIAYVMAGVTHIMKRQQEGWAYIRP